MSQSNFNPRALHEDCLLYTSTVLAFALPVYGVNTYLQKIFSSLRKMGVFAAFNFVAGAAQIALTMFGAANVERFPIEIIAAAEVLFYVVADVCLFAYLRRRLGPFGLRSVAKACARGLLFGGLGAAAGSGVLFALQMFVAPLSGSCLLYTSSWSARLRRTPTMATLRSERFAAATGMRAVLSPSAFRTCLLYTSRCV